MVARRPLFYHRGRARADSEWQKAGMGRFYAMCSGCGTNVGRGWGGKGDWGGQARGGGGGKQWGQCWWCTGEACCGVPGRGVAGRRLSARLRAGATAGIGNVVQNRKGAMREETVQPEPGGRVEGRRCGGRGGVPYASGRQYRQNHAGTEKVNEAQKQACNRGNGYGRCRRQWQAAKGAGGSGSVHVTRWVPTELRRVPLLCRPTVRRARANLLSRRCVKGMPPVHSAGGSGKVRPWVAVEWGVNASNRRRAHEIPGTRTEGAVCQRLGNCGGEW